MTLSAGERQKLLPLLDQLGGAVEEMLLGGLTTASESTRQTLNVAFQEASRLRLLRLSTTLRVANEELGRFTRNEEGFSRKRLIFFLNRSWLLSQGLARAIRTDDKAEWERLLWMPDNRPVDRLEVVTLGVGKKATPAFHAFEFRLRTVSGSGPIPKGQRLLWSCVFPVKQGLGIPPEAFLHLPQKQKFTPHQFLEQKTIVIDRPAVSVTDSGPGRIALGDESKVELGGRFTGWDELRTWDPRDALARIDACKPGPFDLDVELQEEIVLHDWQIEKPEKRDADNVLVYPITCDGIQYDAIVPTTVEGTILKGELDNLIKKKRRQPLFGLMHYEKCRLILQPLSLLPGDGPQYLTLSKDKVDRAALLKTMKF